MPTDPPDVRSSFVITARNFGLGGSNVDAPMASNKLAVSDVEAVVGAVVSRTEAIDVHTHLLPPTHGVLLLHGIDALLTYHYLVAELFMVLPVEAAGDSVTVDAAATSPSPGVFHSMPLEYQADLVFEELFVKRTPLSEACRGCLLYTSPSPRDS